MMAETKAANDKYKCDMGLAVTDDPRFERRFFYTGLLIRYRGKEEKLLGQLNIEIDGTVEFIPGDLEFL